MCWKYLKFVCLNCGNAKICAEERLFQLSLRNKGVERKMHSSALYASINKRAIGT